MTLTRSRALAGFLLLALASPAWAQQPATGAQRSGTPAKAAEAKKDAKPTALGGFGASSKEPIKIDADRLDVFDKEGRAVFNGNVVAVQGDSIMRCTSMSVLYEQKSAARTAGPSAQEGDSSIKRIDCSGPVTVTSKTQTATSDNAVFDKAANKVILTGNAALSDGPNVTRGDRIVYDLDSGVANVEGAKPGDRVKALFVPGSQDKPGDAKPPEAKKPDVGAKPKPAAQNATP